MQMERVLRLNILDLTSPWFLALSAMLDSAQGTGESLLSTFVQSLFSNTKT